MAAKKLASSADDDRAKLRVLVREHHWYWLSGYHGTSRLASKNITEKADTIHPPLFKCNPGCTSQLRFSIYRSKHF